MHLPAALWPALAWGLLRFVILSEPSEAPRFYYSLLRGSPSWGAGVFTEAALEGMLYAYSCAGRRRRKSLRSQKPAAAVVVVVG